MKIGINNLSFSYLDKTIFENSSLELEFNNLYLLYGENGSGKSTFTNILSGNLDPKSGSIAFPEKISSNDIALQQQEIRAFKNLKIKEVEKLWEDINYTLSENKIVLRDILQIQNFENTIIKNLSGGENRSFIVYLTLLLEKKIVILDEPFAGLDKDKKEALIKYIDKDKKNKLYLIVSHEVKGFEKYFNKYIYIDNKNLHISNSFDEMIKEKFYENNF